ncbi:DMT family transporter [Oricola thermophila]|uniref:DMT family transporter n=1 Tax=Oricola thermophila TaxID=2742145 RepID=A0A6N1VC74_9HYPH|nr:DMT family transporter [Oricola thermophila]QKV17135.1 DMT family transporter [Oricola thermophila]
MLQRAAPVVFVLLWSTGFIGSKLGADDAEPFTFLALRFLIVLALLWPVALVAGRRTRGWAERGHAMVAGMLIHGAYLGGVFWAIRHGMPAGVAALIVSLQPVLTSLFAGPLLGERLTTRHWLGLFLGLAGALLVLEPGLRGALAIGSGITVATVAATVCALLGITAGTLWQKRFATGTDLLAGTIWQYVGALALIGAGSLAFETRVIDWTPKFVFALGWLVLVLSIGAIFLLMLLIRQNAVSSVSGLFYLVPACTSVIAFLMFGETLTLPQLAGLVLATLAVLMISGVRFPRRAPV